MGDSLRLEGSCRPSHKSVLRGPDISKKFSSSHCRHQRPARWAGLVALLQKKLSFFRQAEVIWRRSVDPRLQNQRVAQFGIDQTRGRNDPV
jgi:hypothetical protein